MRIDCPVFPGPETEHDSLLERLGSDSGFDVCVGRVQVGEDLGELRLETLPVVGDVRDTLYAESVDLDFVINLNYDKTRLQTVDYCSVRVASDNFRPNLLLSFNRNWNEKHKIIY